MHDIRNTKRGFSLIELSLVALIIAIMVSISTPLFRRTFYNLQLDETSYNIARFMNYARATAITERLKTKISFDFNGKRYWMTINEDTQNPDLFARIEGRFGRSHVIPSVLTVEGADDAIVFYPNGRSEDFKLYLKNNNGITKVIEVREESGHAGVSSYEE